MCVEIGAVEAHHAIAPGFLCHVESVVRCSHKSFLVLHLRVRGSGHTTAHGPAKRATLICKCMILHLLPQPLGECNSGVQNGARQNQQELLSTIAPHSIDLTRFALEDLRDRLQDRVAGLVAVLVVHSLELVDIAHHHGHRLVQANGVAPLLFEPFLE